MPIDVLGFDHIDLTVNEMARSVPFYERVLGELGFSSVPDSGQSAIFANAVVAIAIRAKREGDPEAPFDRYRVGLHHWALRAASRSDVDHFHDFLLRQNIEVLDAPKEYPEYGENYYGVFFADPDGMKLELAHFPWGYWRRAMTAGKDVRSRFPFGKR
jgi:glyoxylase I family protein